jgi:hypothetical protein
MTTSDPFELLRIPRNVSRDEFRQLRRARLRDFHPDRRGMTKAAHDEFHRIKEAIETIERMFDDEAVGRESATASVVFEFTIGTMRVQRVRAGDDLYKFVAVGPRRGGAPFHPVGEGTRVFVREREVVRTKRLRTAGRTFIVLHGLLYPITGPRQRLLAMDVLPLDPASKTPFCIISAQGGWLLVRGADGRLVARNADGVLVRLAGYAAFAETKGAIVPDGERVFPPFETPL